MGYKIELDQEKCIGCGACAASCEVHFEMEGDKAKPKNDEVDEAKCAHEAVEACPVDCIKVTEV